MKRTLTLTLLILAALAWAQTDTPIVIADGSLKMDSTGVPWTSFTGSGNTHSHPNAGKTVTAVDLTVNGNTQTIGFQNQACTVTAQYGTTTITVSTGPNGRGLQVTTDFTKFHRGANDQQLLHQEEHGTIGAVTVRKGTTSAFSGTGTGGTRIVIHYR